MMSLFSELSSIAKLVAEETRRLQAESDYAPGTRPFLYEAASKKLRKEVDDVKSLASDLVTKKKHFGDFKKFLDDVEELLQKNAKAADAFEGYLTKYGYVPSAAVEVQPSTSIADEGKPSVTAAASTTFYEFLSPELSSSPRLVYANGNTTGDVSHRKYADTVPCSGTTGTIARSDESSAISHCRSGSEGVTAPQAEIPTIVIDDKSCATPEAATVSDSQNSPYESSAQLYESRSKKVDVKSERARVQYPSQQGPSYDGYSGQQSSLHSPSLLKQDTASCRRIRNFEKLNFPAREPKSMHDTFVRHSAFITPKTNQSIHHWLKSAQLDGPVSASPFHFHLPKGPTNPLLRNCGELSTPYRTPARTPRTHLVSSASPELDNSSWQPAKLSLRNYKSEPVSSSAPQAFETMDPCHIPIAKTNTGTNFPNLSNSVEKSLGSKPEAILGENSHKATFDLSLEEPTLSDVTINALAELKKSREQQSVPTDLSVASQLSPPSCALNPSLMEPFKGPSKPRDYSCEVEAESSNWATVQEHSLSSNCISNYPQLKTDGQYNSDVDPIKKIEKLNIKSQKATDCPVPSILTSNSATNMIELRKNLNELNTPEEPVIPDTYRSIDTPEEPALSSDFALACVSSLPSTGNLHNPFVPVTSSMQSVIPPSDSVLRKSQLTLHLEESFSDGSKDLQNLLLTELEKSPELSETSQQLLSQSILAKDGRSVLKKDGQLVPSKITSRSDKENCYPLQLVPSKMMRKGSKLDPSKCKIKGLFKQRIDENSYSSWDKTTNIRTSKCFNDMADHLNDASDHEASYLKNSRSLGAKTRPPIDNSFSQAMLQYSHIPPSPMPPPRTHL